MHKLSPLSLYVTFGVGYSPFAPGTFGSIPAFIIASISFYYFGAVGYGIVAATIVLFTVTGIKAIDAYMAHIGKHDPKEVVIDEVVGQLITLLAAAPYIGKQPHGDMRGALLLFACFALFRFFDILKPWPVSWADQKVERGLGVMLDDIFAGIMAAGVFYLGVYGCEAVWG
jgi:phosphatidylglycerophosphatase A